MPERSWTIDVCRICDRLAAWPFCPCGKAARSRGERWTVPVTVHSRAKRTGGGATW